MSTNPNLSLEHLMREAEKMQTRMKKAQEELGDLSVTGESGAGLVKVVMNGRHEVKSVTIRPTLLEEGHDIVGEMAAAAFNDAVRKIESESKRKIGELTAGLNIPDSFLKDKE